MENLICIGFGLNRFFKKNDCGTAQLLSFGSNRTLSGTNLKMTIGSFHGLSQNSILWSYVLIKYWCFCIWDFPYSLFFCICIFWWFGMSFGSDPALFNEVVYLYCNWFKQIIYFRLFSTPFYNLPCRALNDPIDDFVGFALSPCAASIMISKSSKELSS